MQIKTLNLTLFCLAAVVSSLLGVGCSSTPPVDASKPETMLNPKMSAHQKQVKLAHSQQATQ
jgi:hypothetical protein